jgi:hypothetical protein
LCFWLGLAAVAIHLGLRGPINRFRWLSWWRWWELVAVSTTAIYSFYFYAWVLLTGHYQLRDGRLKRGATILILVSSALVTVALLAADAYKLLYHVGGYVCRAKLLAIVGALFLFFDVTVSCRAETNSLKHEFRTSALLLELPLCTALVFTYWAVRQGQGAFLVDGTAHEAFLGGAAAFQLLFGTTAFALIHTRRWSEGNGVSRAGTEANASRQESALC